METWQIVAKIFIVVGFGMVLIVPVLGLISLYINEFVNRGRTNVELGTRWLYGWHCVVRTCDKVTYGTYRTNGDYVLRSYCMPLISTGLLGLIATLGFRYLEPLDLVYIGTALAVLIAPRYLGDILHALKWCFKSKDSMRLKELEAEVEKLKGGR